MRERLHQVMDERGWSRYELAKRAGLSETTIANLFRRCNASSIPTLEAITKACGITMYKPAVDSRKAEAGGSNGGKHSFDHKRAGGTFACTAKIRI
ncbi:helix-turn-helix domain-containing protein [Allofournierella sp.]|uniref:helix-turn-helix domain-containing protein n=1 Tax=Allofournierella sp. TaxID=1940256 RepID=UPI003AB80834